MEQNFSKQQYKAYNILNSKTQSFIVSHSCHYNPFPCVCSQASEAYLEFDGLMVSAQ